MMVSPQASLVCLEDSNVLVFPLASCFVTAGVDYVEHSYTLALSVVMA